MLVRNVPTGCSGGGPGVVDERGGAEHCGEDGEEAERHRQRHPRHRQIQRYQSAVEQQSQRHGPLFLSLRLALACDGMVGAACSSLEPRPISSRLGRQNAVGADEKRRRATRAAAGRPEDDNQDPRETR
jgi:hypothetical protein